MRSNIGLKNIASEARVGIAHFHAAQPVENHWPARCCVACWRSARVAAALEYLCTLTRLIVRQIRHFSILRFAAVSRESGD